MVSIMQHSSPRTYRQEFWRTLSSVCYGLWYILRNIPWALRRFVKHPLQSTKAIFGILRFGVFDVAPWAYRELKSIASEHFDRKYWKVYHSAKDSRRAHLRRRRRALTPLGRRAPIQHSCMFLTRLPPEIRNPVYEHYFGGHTLGIIAVKRGWHTRLVAFPVPVDVDKRFNIRARFNGGVRSGLLDLSLSCKQIYSETIHLLYTRNTFCFTAAEQLMPLHQHLLPQRWNSITSLLFDPHADWIVNGQNHAYNRRQGSWLQFWGLVNTMSRLEKVVVKNMNLDYRWSLAPALLQVTKPLEIFDVHLVEAQFLIGGYKPGVDLGNVQFKLILPDGRPYAGPNATLAEATRRTLRL